MNLRINRLFLLLIKSSIFTTFSLPALAMELDSERDTVLFEQFSNDCENVFQGKVITRELIISRYILCGSFQKQTLSDDKSTQEHHRALVLLMKDQHTEAQRVLLPLAATGSVLAMNNLANIDRKEGNFRSAIGWATMALETEWATKGTHNNNSIGVLRNIRNNNYNSLKNDLKEWLDWFLANYEKVLHQGTANFRISFKQDSIFLQLDDSKRVFELYTYLSSSEKKLRTAWYFLQLTKDNWQLFPQIFDFEFFTAPKVYALDEGLLRRRILQLHLTHGGPVGLANLTEKIASKQITHEDIKNLGRTNSIIDGITNIEKYDSLQLAAKILIDLLHPHVVTPVAYAILARFFLENKLTLDTFIALGGPHVFQHTEGEHVTEDHIAMSLLLKSCEKNGVEPALLFDIGRVLAKRTIDPDFVRRHGALQFLSRGPVTEKTPSLSTSMYAIAFFIEAYLLEEFGFSELDRREAKNRACHRIGWALYKKHISPKDLEKIGAVSALGLSIGQDRHLPLGMMGSSRAAAMFFVAANTKSAQYDIGKIVEKTPQLPPYLLEIVEQIIGKQETRNHLELAAQIYAASGIQNAYVKLGSLVQQNTALAPLAERFLARDRGSSNPHELAAMLYGHVLSPKASVKLGNLIIEKNLSIRKLKRLGVFDKVSVNTQARIKSLDTFNTGLYFILAGHRPESLKTLTHLLIRRRASLATNFPTFAARDAANKTELERKIIRIAHGKHSYLWNDLGVLFQEKLLGEELSEEERTRRAEQCFKNSKTREGNYNLAVLYANKTLAEELSAVNRHKKISELLEPLILAGNKKAMDLLLTMNPISSEDETPVLDETTADSAIDDEESETIIHVAEKPTRKERKEELRLRKTQQQEKKREKVLEKDARKKANAKQRAQEICHMPSQKRERQNLVKVFLNDSGVEYSHASSLFLEKIDNFYDDICENPFELEGRGKPEKLKAKVRGTDPFGHERLFSLFSRHITHGDRFVYYVVGNELRIWQVGGHYGDY